MNVPSIGRLKVDTHKQDNEDNGKYVPTELHTDYHL